MLESFLFEPTQVLYEVDRRQPWASPCYCCWFRIPSIYGAHARHIPRSSSAKLRSTGKRLQPNNLVPSDDRSPDQGAFIVYSIYALASSRTIGRGCLRNLLKGPRQVSRSTKLTLPASPRGWPAGFLLSVQGLGVSNTRPLLRMVYYMVCSFMKFLVHAKPYTGAARDTHRKSQWSLLYEVSLRGIRARPEQCNHDRWDGDDFCSKRLGESHPEGEHPPIDNNVSFLRPKRTKTVIKLD